MIVTRIYGLEAKIDVRYELEKNFLERKTNNQISMKYVDSEFKD